MPENPDRPPLEDKDHYSYQEMLERLEKVRSSGHGMKTKRKRKRRSHQPVKEKRKSRLFKTLLFLGILLPLLIVLCGSLFFSYMAYQSDPFRIAISTLVSERMGIDGQFARRFHISKGSFSNDVYSGTGGPDNFIQRIEARNIRARVPMATLFRKHWPIDTLVIEDLSATLNPVPGTETTALNQIFPQIFAAGLGMIESPDSLDLKRFTINNLDLIFGSDTTKRPNHLIRAKTNVTGETTGDSLYHGTIREGELLYSFWPIYNLVEANIIVHSDKQIEITSAKLRQDSNRGGIDVAGTIKLGQPGRGANLELRITDLDVNQIFLQSKVKTDDLSWSDHILGKISGDLLLNSSLEIGGDTTLTGSISGTDICVKGLPMLNKLAMFSEHYLDRITFTTFTAELEQTNHIVKLTDIFGRVGYDGAGRKTDSYSITGNLTMNSLTGETSGEFEWKFEKEMADNFQFGRPAFLSGKKGESGTVKVKLQGTLDNMYKFADKESGYSGPPTDTLSPLLEMPESTAPPKD